MKTFPKVGDKLYLRQFTGNYWVDMVRHPYTVVSVSKSKVIVQECLLHFPIFKYDPNTMDEYYKQFDGKETRFYDTLPESIEHDPNGHLEELSWHSKRNMWGTKGKDSDYPDYAVFGNWDFQPYLN